MKKEPLTCQKALKITHILFYSGLILMGLALAIGAAANSTGVLVVISVIGLIAAIVGLFFGFSYVRCPECGGSLMAGGKIPGSLPNYCPHCGKTL